MADINPNDSATLTDGLEIDSYDDVVNLLGAGEAAAMLADAVGNRFNRQDIMKAILTEGISTSTTGPNTGSTTMPRASAANCSRTPRLRGPMTSSTQIRSRRTRG